MAQYINKDTVVKEIHKIYDNDYKFLPSDIVEGVQNFKDDLLMNLDALEVKEVDLEKQLKEDIEEKKKENRKIILCLKARTRT